MLLQQLDSRLATTIRLIGLVLISLSVLRATPAPGSAGRELVISILLAVSIVSWLVWTVRPGREASVLIELYALAAAGGALVGASPHSAASAFVFVAVVVAGARTQLARAVPVLGVGVLAVAISTLVYDGSELGLLAYVLGLAAALMAAATARQRVVRAEQAELLLAQAQRTHEEQLRSARLEESARIAREIHDVLAHALAGLSIQLEATTALIEQGADPQAVLARVCRAHELARDGLRETRRAVGALRGEDLSAAASLDALVRDYRVTAEAPATLRIEGDAQRLSGPGGETVVRVVQEALTNVHKHAPGAAVSVAVDAGSAPGDDVVVVVEDRAPAALPARGLAEMGGGYGLRGMRERAELLGGTLNAGGTAERWRVQLRLPAPGRADR